MIRDKIIIHVSILKYLKDTISFKYLSRVWLIVFSKDDYKNNKDIFKIVCKRVKRHLFKVKKKNSCLKFLNLVFQFFDFFTAATLFLTIHSNQDNRPWYRALFVFHQYYVPIRKCDGVAISNFN